MCACRARVGRPGGTGAAPRDLSPVTRRGGTCGGDRGDADSGRRRVGRAGAALHWPAGACSPRLARNRPGTRLRRGGGGADGCRDAGTARWDAGAARRDAGHSTPRRRAQHATLARRRACRHSKPRTHDAGHATAAASVPAQRCSGAAAAASSAGSFLAGLATRPAGQCGLPISRGWTGPRVAAATSPATDRSSATSAALWACAAVAAW